MRLPNLKHDEKITLWSQGTLYIRDTWQQGFLFLTNNRLIFNQITKTTFETSLNDIIKLSIEKKAWYFGVRVNQLRIDFNSEKGKDTIYLTVSKPKKWSYKIKDGMTLMLAEGWGYNGANTKPTGDT